MPIPTRTVSGKDARKQSVTAGRAVSNLKPPTAASKPTEETPSKALSSKPAPSTLPTRRQSLVRPSQLKPPSSASVKSNIPSAGKKTIGRGPVSPVKSDDTVKQQSGRPTSPRKPEMPPPPRPVRSASLRQPSTSTTGTPAAPRGHTRHRSQVVIPASKPHNTATPAATSTRNQFSTYQQQFSPKKATNTPTPTPSTSLSTERVSSLIPSSWPEIAALQTELLQLSLLHQSWLQRNQQWESEAKAHLRSKYNSVASDYRAILTEEKESQRKDNAQALQYWLKNAREHNGQHGFAEQVRLLSQIAQEVYNISDAQSGRHTMAILQFECWLQRVEGNRDARCERVAREESDDFINAIDQNWKEEINALIMKLELLSRQLQSLDILGYGEVEALQGSALLRTARGLDEMVNRMVEELRVVRKIEADIVKAEAQRVSQLAQHLVEAHLLPRQDSATPKTGLWTQTFTS